MPPIDAAQPRNEPDGAETIRHESSIAKRRPPALTVYVDERGVEAAIRVFKRLVIKEGLLKDIKRHERYEKPGDRKRRKTREAIRRRRRQAARTRDRYGDRG